MTSEKVQDGGTNGKWNRWKGIDDKKNKKWLKNRNNLIARIRGRWGRRIHKTIIKRIEEREHTV